MLDDPAMASNSNVFDCFCMLLLDDWTWDIWEHIILPFYKSCWILCFHLEGLGDTSHPQEIGAWNQADGHESHLSDDYSAPTGLGRIISKVIL